MIARKTGNELVNGWVNEWKVNRCIYQRSRRAVYESASEWARRVRWGELGTNIHHTVPRRLSHCQTRQAEWLMHQIQAGWVFQCCSLLRGFHLMFHGVCAGVWKCMRVPVVLRAAAVLLSGGVFLLYSPQMFFWWCFLMHVFRQCYLILCDGGALFSMLSCSFMFSVFLMGSLFRVSIDSIHLMFQKVRFLCFLLCALRVSVMSS